MMNGLLTRIFHNEAVAANVEVGQLQTENVPVTWLPLIDVSRVGHRLGLADNGEWVVEGKQGLLTLKEPASFLFVLVLLEKPLAHIKEELFQSTGSAELASVVERTFPFGEIVRAGLAKRSKYWAELAFQWYDELSPSDKQRLREIVESVASAKWASQKLRQRATQELRRLTSQAGK